LILHVRQTNGDRHSFTIGEPYNKDKESVLGQHGTVTFKATEDGTFEFFCKYRQPTTRGEPKAIIMIPKYVPVKEDRWSYLLHCVGCSVELASAANSSEVLSPFLFFLVVVPSSSSMY
jgi:hypothetical protein